MTKRLSLAIASCLVLAAPSFAVRAETTGKGPAPEATNPAPSRDMNQTDRQNAAPPGKDTGPATRSGAGEPSRTDADHRHEQGSGASGTAAPGGPSATKPAR